MAQALPVTGGATNAKVFAIAKDTSKSVDGRQREIVKLDPPKVAWDRPQWHDLMPDVTERAHRDTSWWKVDRRKLRNGDEAG